MNLIRIAPDKEKAKNILEMIGLIEERINTQYKIKFAPLIISDYYEIIKELITALLLIDGYKTLSNKDLITYLKLNYLVIDVHEIILIDTLRIIRNRVTYEGFKIQKDYLEDNKLKYIQIIKKLKSLIEGKLK